MKNLFLIFAITFIAAFSNAAILPGTYSGNVTYLTGKNGRSYTQKKDLSIYVQLASPEATDLAYALIVDDYGKFASLYRVEELPDGNQLWIQIYQGQNNVLKVNDSASPDFNGTLIVGGYHTRLILKPTEQRVRCGESEIDVSLSGDSKWMPLPKETMSFKMNDGTYSTYDGSTFKGEFVVENYLYQGVFQLTNVLPNVASLRKSVVDQKALSGYHQEKQITGVVTNVGSRRNNLLFIGLPVGAKQCGFSSQFLRNE